MKCGKCELKGCYYFLLIIFILGSVELLQDANATHLPNISNVQFQQNDTTLTITWDNPTILPEGIFIEGQNLRFYPADAKDRWNETIYKSSIFPNTSAIFNDLEIGRTYNIKILTYYATSIDTEGIRSLEVQYTFTTQSDKIPTSKGSSGCSDCKAPIISFPTIQNGFIINGNSTDVSNSRITDFPVEIKIGEPTTFLVKVFENRGIDNIYLIKLGFGISNPVLPISEAESIIEIIPDNTLVKSLKIFDESKLFLKNSTSIILEETACNTANNLKCLQLNFTTTFAEIPDTDMLMIIVSDKNNRSSSVISGLTVEGDALNKQSTIQIYNRYTATSTDGFFIDLTMVDKVNEMWIDDKDRLWKELENDQWKLIG